jgi:hypothetical protein
MRIRDYGNIPMCADTRMRERAGIIVSRDHVEISGFQRLKIGAEPLARCSTIDFRL